MLFRSIYYVACDCQGADRVTCTKCKGTGRIAMVDVEKVGGGPCAVVTGVLVGMFLVAVFLLIRWWFFK